MPRGFLRENTDYLSSIEQHSINHSKQNNLEKFHKERERSLEAYQLQNNGLNSIKLDNNTSEGKETIKRINNLLFGKDNSYRIETTENLNSRAEAMHLTDIDNATNRDILDDIRAMNPECLREITQNADNIARQRFNPGWDHFSTNIDRIHDFVFKNAGYAGAVAAYKQIERKYLEGDYNEVIVNDWEILTNRPDERKPAETTELVNRYQDLFQEGQTN